MQNRLGPRPSRRRRGPTPRIGPTHRRPRPRPPERPALESALAQPDQRSAVDAPWSDTASGRARARESLRKPSTSQSPQGRPPRPRAPPVRRLRAHTARARARAAPAPPPPCGERCVRLPAPRCSTIAARCWTTRRSWRRRRSRRSRLRRTMGRWPPSDVFDRGPSRVVDAFGSATFPMLA